MPFNIPNSLTWARIALIPIFVGVYYLPGTWLSDHERNLIAAGIFIVAAVTDWFDGYLARTLHQTSAFGAFLDPVADKLMVAAALVLLVQAIPTPLMAVTAMIIIGREIAISALREWMAQIGGHGRVAVSMIGKIKTTAQMVAVLLLLYREPFGGFFPTLAVGQGLLLVAAVLTLWSMLHYLLAAWPALKA